MMTKPAIVIVPGAFCPPVLYENIRRLLQSSEYQVHIVSHHSNGSPFSPPPSMYDDAAQIHDLLLSLADQGKEIVLVMHSYGGLPGTESVKNVSLSERKDQGKPGGVSRLLYVASVVADEGMPVEGPPGIHMAWDFVEHGWYGVPRDFMIESGWSDLTIERAETYANELVPMSPQPLQDPLTWPGYKYIPCSWFLTEADKITSPDLQRAYIKKLEAARGESIDVHSYPVDHFPAITSPQALARCIKEVSGEKIAARF